MALERVCKLWRVEKIQKKTHAGGGQELVWEISNKITAMSQLPSLQILAQMTALPVTLKQPNDAASTVVAVIVFVVVIVVSGGLLGILSTPVLILENPNTGMIKKAPTGFSWTTLFFQAWPAFFRADYKAFFIQALTDYIFIVGIFIWPFIYNRMYLNKLLERGYKVKAVRRMSLEQARKKLGINLPVLHSGAWSTNSPMPVQLITAASIPAAPGPVSTRQIYFHKNEQQMGPYTEQQVRDMLLSGSIDANDLAWYEGLSNWQSLSTIMPTRNVAAPLPPSNNQASDMNIALPVFLLMLLGAGIWYFYFSGKIGGFKKTKQQTSTPYSDTQPVDTTSEPPAAPSMSPTSETPMAGTSQSVDQSTPPIIASPVPLAPFLSSPTQASYSVVGIPSGDALNVHSGPASTSAITARLPNGYDKITIVGDPIMNDTTAWVNIAFRDSSGWVNKAYLGAETQGGVVESPSPQAADSSQNFINPDGSYDCDKAAQYLTDSYKQCLAKVPRQQQEQVRVPQRAWIKFSDANETAIEAMGKPNVVVWNLEAQECIARGKQLEHYNDGPSESLAQLQTQDYEAESDLTSVYNEIVSGLSEGNKNNLVQAERAWVDYKEKNEQANAVVNPSGQGLPATIVVINRRVEELKAIYQ